MCFGGHNDERLRVGQTKELTREGLIRSPHAFEFSLVVGSQDASVQMNTGGVYPAAIMKRGFA
jgi:hypothetical protein